MRFTTEDFNQIRDWLEFNGIKDSQFPPANLPLRGDESIVLTQNGINVQMPLMTFVAQVSILSGNVDIDFIRETIMELLDTDPNVLLPSLLYVMTNSIQWDADASAEDEPSGPSADVNVVIEDI